MSVPPEIMELMSGDENRPEQNPDDAAPAAAGMAMPQRKSGDEAAAKTKIQIAQNMLEQTLPVYDSESEEGRAITRVLSMLNERFGKESQQDLIPAQIMALVNAEPSLNGGALKQQMQQQQQQQAPRPAQPPGMIPGAPPDLGKAGALQ